MPREYSLKRKSTRQYFERFKFMIADLIATRSEPNEDQLIELTYLSDRLYDEADLGWISAHWLEMRNLSNLQGVLSDRNGCYIDKFEFCKRLISEYNMKLRVGCAYFGKKLIKPNECLLRKRTPNSRNASRSRRRFIGVGYKDHGTMKNIAEDGTPHWKEVSAAQIPDPRKIRPAARRILKLNYGRFRRHPINRQQE